MEGSFDNCTDFERTLSLSGEYVTQVSGVSMCPMLRYRRDPVLIRPVCRELKRYDVAVYNRGDGYVIHRILEVRPDCYVFRGDNCIGKEIIPKSLVVGVVVGFWRIPRRSITACRSDAPGCSVSGRFVSVENRCYRIYSRVWVALNPADVRLVAFLRRLPGFPARIFRKIRR